MNATVDALLVSYAIAPYRRVPRREPQTRALSQSVIYLLAVTGRSPAKLKSLAHIRDFYGPQRRQECGAINLRHFLGPQMLARF